jgi:hypothetical protein
VPLGDVTDDLKAAVPQQRSAIAACANAWLRKHAQLSVLEDLPRTVPVTSRQWDAVLADSELPILWDTLDDCIRTVLMVSSLPAKEIGRHLFERLDSALAAQEDIQSALLEVGRFVPAVQHNDPSHVLRRLQKVADQELQVAINCLTEDLDLKHWDALVALAAERELLMSELDSAAAQALASHDELPLERAMGLSTAAISAGDAISFSSRLAVLWTKESESLDNRLRKQLPHLLDDVEILSEDVRRHLTTLFIVGYPLSAHAAAVASRGLVSAALAADPDGCLEVVAELVDEEAGAYATHRQMIHEVSVLNKVEQPEDAMVPACNMYQRVVESDVRRSARLVLGLLGERVDREMTLAPLADRLGARADQPACALVLSCINRSWRNAIAHSQFHWDSVKQCVSLDGESVTSGELVSAARRAHDVYLGLNAGLEVALNHAGNPHHYQPPPTDVFVLDSWVPRKLGELGISIIRMQRRNKVIQLLVPLITISNLRDHLIGVLSVHQFVQQVEFWEIAQRGRPSIMLDAKTLAAAATLVEVGVGANGNGSVHPHSAELVLLAGALLNSNQASQQVARSVMMKAAYTFLGERDMLRRRLIVGDENAVLSIAATIDRLIAGTSAAASILPRPARRRLGEFSEILSNQRKNFEKIGPKALCKCGPVEQVVQANRSLGYPWLESTSVE